MKQKINKIDVEPKWVNLVPLFIDWIKNGTNEQRTIATSELNKMAVACDKIRALQKKGIENV